MTILIQSDLAEPANTRYNVSGTLLCMLCNIQSTSTPAEVHAYPTQWIHMSILPYSKDMMSLLVLARQTNAITCLLHAQSHDNFVGLLQQSVISGESFETYKTQLRCKHLQQLAIVCRADTRQAVADLVHVTPHLIYSGIDFVHCVLRSTAQLILQLTTPEQPLASSCLATVMDSLITWHLMQQVHTQLAGVNTWSHFTHLYTRHRPTGSEVMWHYTATLELNLCLRHTCNCMQVDVWPRPLVANTYRINNFHSCFYWVPDNLLSSMFWVLINSIVVSADVMQQLKSAEYTSARHYCINTQ